MRRRQQKTLILAVACFALAPIVAASVTDETITGSRDGDGLRILFTQDASTDGAAGSPSSGCESDWCVAVPDGRLVIALVDAEAGETPGHWTIDADRSGLRLSIVAAGAGYRSGQVLLYTDSVPGSPPDAQVASSNLSLGAGETAEVELAFPSTGIQPGTYRLAIAAAAPTDSRATLVVTHPGSASLLAAAPPPFGPNIALAALGGEVVAVSDSHDVGGWLPENLIDGFTEVFEDRGTVLSRGWQARRTTAADITLAFRDRRAATIDAVGFSPVETTASPRTLAQYERSSPVPRNVEIWVSDTQADADFRRVAEARLYRATVPQLVRFGPTEARYVRLKILDTHGSNEVAMGELMVFESPSAAPSLLEGASVNLAEPALGGFVAGVTSAADRNGAWQLADGTSGADSGWMSAATSNRPASFTPQDIVFGFGNDDAAFIERIEIDPLSGPASSVGDMSRYQARQVLVSTASEPGGEWQDVGRIDLPRDNSLHAIGVGRTAARVRIRVLANHGGPASSLGEVRIIEGAREGYESLARGARTWLGPRPPAVAAAGDTETRVAAPVDTALPRNTRKTGRLAAIEQTDRYRLRVDSPSTAALTFRLTGTPNVRTALELLDERGALVKSFMPNADAGDAANLTWLVAPGSYTAEITETPIVQTVAFDTSGSMSGRIGALEEAVRRYVASARADEFINLVRFHGEVEPLLTEFTNDKSVLSAALDGQFRADGGTALIDALYRSAELVRSRRGRQVVVAFTDGQDTSSEGSAARLDEYIDAGPLLVYSIGFGDSLTSYNRRTGSNGHQFLASLSRTIAGSRYFSVQHTADLDATFSAIGAELRAPADYSISADYTDARGALRVATTGEMIPGLSPPRFELIVDASGSMKRTSGGQSRMAVAKSVLKSVLEQIPDNTEIGLRAFGHRIAEGQAGDCEDSELIVPFSAGDKDRVVSAIDGLTALGTTPIAYSVEQAMQDIAAAGNEQETIVIVVTDGEEECRDDLLQVVESARNSGIGFSLNVVGFELDEQTTLDLEGVAEAGGGAFFAAADADQLGDAMAKVLSAPYRVLDGSGDIIATGVINGEPLELFAGVYSVRIDASGVNLTIPDVPVEAEIVRSIRLNRQGDSVGVEK